MVLKKYKDFGKIAIMIYVFIVVINNGIISSCVWAYLFVY